MLIDCLRRHRQMTVAPLRRRHVRQRRCASPRRRPGGPMSGPIEGSLESIGSPIGYGFRRQVAIRLEPPESTHVCCGRSESTGGLVQRWPAVPTAPKRVRADDQVPGRRSRCMMIMALLPPSSSRQSGRVGLATAVAHVPAHPAGSRWREISGRRRSAIMRLAHRLVIAADDEPEEIAWIDQPSGLKMSWLRMTSCVNNLGHRDGAQRASTWAGLPDHRVSTDGGQHRVPGPDRATGKLKAVMMPMVPSGCHCSYMRCSGPLGVDRQSIELTGESRRRNRRCRCTRLDFARSPSGVDLAAFPS